MGNTIPTATLAIACCGLWTATTAFGEGLDDPLISEGKWLFEEGASDTGCATCHGKEAIGDPDAGGVYIRGVLVSQMESAMNGGVEQMSGLFDLDQNQIDAIQAYLDYLYRAETSQVDPRAFPGMKIFQETAGGVGCQKCHRDDATGDVGPNIQGRTAEDIRHALTTVEKMDFIELNDEEVEQVATYLNFLMEASGK